MTILLALLLAQATPDLCTSIKDIVKSAPADFERVRGKKHEDHIGWMLWTDPAMIAGAQSCTVFDPQRGDRSYACAIDVAASCDAMAKRFAELSQELQGCFEKPPKLLEAKKELDAIFHPSEVFVEVAFFRGDRCSLAIEIEPPGNQHQGLPYLPMGMQLGPR